MMFRKCASLLLPLLLLLTVIGSLPPASASDDTNTSEPVCDFQCFNNATCAWGPQSVEGHPAGLDFHEELMRDGKHCACPPGLTGLRCAREYTSCYDDLHMCYHGGKCITGLEDDYGNSQYFCDCNDAKDENGTRYAGKYCEHKAIETCDDSNAHFCVNGGTCKENWEEHLHYPCRCAKDFEGPHCEFKTGQVPDCTLECLNEGTCQLGIKNFAVAMLGIQDSWNASINAMHCQCKPGFFGLRCEIESSKCGKQYCFNGGQCVTLTDGSKHCDCTTAGDSQKSYAGRFCQHEATSFCEKDNDVNGRDFCTNGGSCRKTGTPGCDCPSGWTGPTCEHHESEVNETSVCSLQCHNGGVCMKGAKDWSFLDKYGPEAAHIKNVGHTESFEHCKCPDGFTGILCEKRIETCGDNAHICLYGAPCVQDEDGNYGCNCAEATQSTKFDRFAGVFCQHKASEFCTLDGKPGTGNEARSFCVNGGSCNDKVDGNGHTGCTCGSMYKGDHCQFMRMPNDGYDESASPSDDSGSSTGLGVILGTIFAVLFAVGSVAFVLIKRRKKMMRAGKEFDTSSVATDSTGKNSPYGMQSSASFFGALEPDETDISKVEIL